MAWARELARYFVLGYTKGSWIERELDERPREDPYPDLSMLVGVEPTLVSPAAKIVRRRESTPAASSASRCRSVV